jgi:hypothetical protein
VCADAGTEKARLDLLTIIFGLLGFLPQKISGAAMTALPHPIPTEAMQVFGVSITPLEISVALGVLLVMGDRAVGARPCWARRLRRSRQTATRPS